MSRIGKRPIPLPAKVAVTIDGSYVQVTGPNGTLEHRFNPDITINQEDGHIVITRPTDLRHHRALHGLTRALLSNMVTGVSDGFVRVLEIEGVGYRAEISGSDLLLHVGYSHEVRVVPPDHVTFEVPSESKGRQIHIKGNNKQVVGELAANIRKIRPPEPYKGKGIRYKGEQIRMKAGKAGKGK